jgi:hypothetical protein
MKTIEIVVAPDGGTTVQTKGFVAGECRDASRFVETALGRSTDDRPTAEGFQAIPAERRIEQNG